MSIKPPKPPGGTDPGELRRRFTDALRTDWRSIAREEQLPPAGDWSTWIFCAGRGSGKTRSGAEWIQERVETGQARRIHLIAPTAADCRDVMLEGPAGILSIAQPNMRPVYSSSLRKLVWPTGAQALLFSSDEPDRLRGPQADTIWIDELCAMRSAQEVLDMAMFGLRLGKDPKCLITTTPRPIKPFKALVARDGQDVVITRCSTMANAENLARPFLSQIMQQYQGTRLGRQELNAELLLDVPGALWTLDMIESTRVKNAPTQFQRIVIGVDPAGSTAEWADQTGIVACGLGMDNHVYVIEDASGSYTPSQWAQVVVDMYHRYGADRICVERNYGGDMVEATIRTADPSVAIKTVTSSRGKVLRAEPISALWEQKRAHVVGAMPLLEDQACNFTHSWDRARDGSPDRLDAMIFGITELTSSVVAGGYFSPGLLLSNGEPVAIHPNRLGYVLAVSSTSSKSGERLGTVYFAVDEHKVTPWPLVILGYDLISTEESLEKYLPRLYKRLKSFARRCEGENKGLWVHGTSGVCAALLKRATELHFPANDIDERVPWGAAPLAERASAAAIHVHPGRRLKISREAQEELVEYKGFKRNHLLAQFSAFKIDAELEADELLRALLSGVLITLSDSRAAAIDDMEIAAPPPAPPAPPPPPAPNLLPNGQPTTLAAGRHVDGQGRIFYVRAPGGGIRIDLIDGEFVSQSEEFRLW